METLYQTYLCKAALVLVVFLLGYVVLMLFFKRKKTFLQEKTCLTILERTSLTPKIQLFLIAVEGQKYLLTDAHQQVIIRKLDHQDEDHEAQSGGK